MVKHVLPPSKKISAAIAVLAGVKALEMSHTAITRNCDINIDHMLGQQAGEMSACWVYFKGKDGKLVGEEGFAYIFTTKHQLVPMYEVIMWGEITMNRYLEQFTLIKPLMSGYVKTKIKQAIVADLVRCRMLS